MKYSEVIGQISFPLRVNWHISRFGEYEVLHSMSTKFLAYSACKFERNACESKLGIRREAVHSGADLLHESDF